MDDSGFFASPAEQDPQWARHVDSPREAYRPLGVLTAWVVGLLAAICILDIFDIGLSAVALLLLDRVATAPHELPAGSYGVLGISEMAMGGLRVVTYVASVIVFLIWFRRAYRNLMAFDATAAMRYAPGWAVGAWFVPFLNLVRPKRIMDDIWRASDPDPDASRAGWRDVRPPTMIMIWWLAWLVSLSIHDASFDTFLAAESHPELVNAYRLTIAAAIFDALAAVLAIVVVLRVSDRQRRRAIALARRGEIPAVFRHPSYV